MNSNSCDRGLDGLCVGNVGAGRTGFVAGLASFEKLKNQKKLKM